MFGQKILNCWRTTVDTVPPSTTRLRGPPIATKSQFERKSTCRAKSLNMSWTASHGGATPSRSLGTLADFICVSYRRIRRCCFSQIRISRWHYTPIDLKKLSSGALL
jgi:hypothetical protein